MFAALQEAELALEENEVPIGAVVVHENKIIGRGHNQTQMLNDATAHAEIIAITAASNNLQSKYLENCDIYITVEPCIMCAGAILLSHLKRVYFGTFEPKLGAAGSIYNLLENNKYNHSIEIYSGIYADESKHLMQSYFLKKRVN
ncbi:MAG: nucleoside deaminase [Ignavibacteriae bacterium]|nr:nucleoside deaminase [Ignavibacteriota bacterium]MCB9209740.1 nucleoside deaminase [Ignavibacteriales bacterium]MCB9218896.1 nucleoside deaminase [Ignavibacteriales bacterium]